MSHTSSTSELFGKSRSLSSRLNTEVSLFLASFATLYFELVIIRYLSTEIRIFANLKNLPLMASFFGIGLGMLLGNPSRRTRRALPAVTASLFLITRFAQQLHLSFGDVSWGYTLGSSGGVWTRTLLVVCFLVVSLGYSALTITFFTVIGGFVGRDLNQMHSLKGYGINLAGSLAGLAAFSCLALLHLGPTWWIGLGFLLLAPLIIEDRLTIIVFVIILVVMAVPEPHTFWSPYNRIDLVEIPRPADWPRSSAYSLAANHSWYQFLVDLSPDFLKRYPKAEPNHSVVPYYELPYQLVPHPRNVLILGAGTGNDVAGALRHGAEHIDAVEIDPVILEIGRTRHPEHPYESPRVTAYADDARSFLRKTKTKYDLVVFAFLDSTTLLSSFSSLRLDNYVYTVESFRIAKTVLSEQGSLILSFAAGRSFATDRLYATLETAFGVPPTAFFTGYWVKGVLLVEGQARNIQPLQMTDASEDLREKTSHGVLLATDSWPFLYLTDRSIPASVLVTAGLFLLMAWGILRRVNLIAWKTKPLHLHFFSWEPDFFF